MHRSPKTLPDPLVAPLADVNAIVDLITLLTEENRAKVENRLRQEVSIVGTNVAAEMNRRNLKTGVWCEELLKFYQETDAFLYETAVWNSCPIKLQLRAWIARFLTRSLPQGSRILCFGDGLGFDSAHLALCGYEVTSYDVSPLNARFSQVVYQANKVRVERIDQETELAGRMFDAILCLDVLEHLPDPVAQVKSLTDWLIPGGLMVVNAPFYLVSKLRGTHLWSNRRFSGDTRKLYRSNGLIPIACRLMHAPIVLERKTELTRIPLLQRWLIPANSLLMMLARIWSRPYELICDALLQTNTQWKQTLKSQSIDPQEPSAPRI